MDCSKPALRYLINQGVIECKSQGSTIDRLLEVERKANQSVFADLFVEKDNTDDESRDLVADTSTLAPLVSLTGGLLCDEKSADLVSNALAMKSSEEKR